VYTLGAAPAPTIAPRAVTVTPAAAPRPIAIQVKSPLLGRVIAKAVAARAAQTEVRTGVPVSLRYPLLNAAVQKAIAARTKLNPVTPATPSVIEQTGINPPVTATPTISPSSPFQFTPDAGGGGGGSAAPSPAVTATPDVQEAGIFPGDTTDQMSQIDQAEAAGDLSAQEVASIKADLAAKPAAAVPQVGTSWIPVVLLLGLVGIAVSQSRRTGGRIGRRGWGD
jgi:hypothetical protein